MRVLLDTAVVLFLATRPDRVKPDLLSQLEDVQNTEIFISAASYYETALKARLGKLPAATSTRFDQIITDFIATPLPVTPAHARRAGRFDLIVRDPFDRLIAAQALEEDLTVISPDPAFARLGAPVLWA